MYFTPFAVSSIVQSRTSKQNTKQTNKFLALLDLLGYQDARLVQRDNPKKEEQSKIKSGMKDYWNDRTFRGSINQCGRQQEILFMSAVLAPARGEN